MIQINLFSFSKGLFIILNLPISKLKKNMLKKIVFDKLFKRLKLINITVLTGFCTIFILHESINI